MRGPLPPLPAMACPLIEAAEAPKLDGNLDEAIWSKGDLQKKFHRYYFGLDRPQEFRLLTDGQWLYVGVVAYEQEISAQDNEHVSIYIAPHKDSDQYVGLSVTMNAQGVAKTSPLTLEGERQDLKAAFRQHADRWVAEIAIRAAPVFGGELSKGKVFDFNLCRTRSRVVGDTFDVAQQWSNTGTSAGSRYRFGEVVVGRAADRVPVIRGELRRELEVARGRRGDLSAASLKEFTKAEREAEALLAASPGEGALTSDAVRAYQRQADALKRKLLRAVLAPRGRIVWACNPMTIPGPRDLPSADQEDVKRLDIRVLANEWESAALVVTNLAKQTLDGQVLLTDFVSSDGKTKAPGWDVLQVRTAPLYLLATGTRKRDPLPRLQQGDLFRVAPDENELLWLTFKSRDLAPGRYTATLTVRALDDQVLRNIELVLRIYPLALGAEGRPWVNPWHYRVRGKDLAQRAAHCRDYYINVGHIYNTGVLPLFLTDAEGKLLSDRLEASSFDRYLDEFLPVGADMWLIVVFGLQNRLLAQWNEAVGNGPDLELWSPQFNDVFARWVVAFRDHMAARRMPPDSWAFYVRDEPAPGKWRQEVINFARQVEKAAPEVRTYITLQLGTGDDAQNLEVSRWVDIIQIIGTAKPQVMAQVRASAEVWSYGISNRGQSPFGHRRGYCWKFLRRGDLGTGFWVWEGVAGGPRYPMDIWREDKHRFTALYAHHDNTLIPSLRSEAFREGIEDWKYVLMLDDAIARATEKGIAKSVIEKAVAFRATCLADLKDADSIEPFRTATRDQLLALHIALGDIDAVAVAEIDK